PVGSSNAQLEHKDIAHPITQSFREYLQKKIIEAYEQEKVKGPSSSVYSDLTR
ncbi:MAG: septation protein SpoVG family protein, partial [Deltaproteobacteria bacterium]